MSILSACYQLGKIYAAWIVLHYLAAHIYVYSCVPATIYGFAISPFLATTPHCQVLRWAIYEGGNNLNMLWITLSAAVLNLVLTKKKQTVWAASADPVKSPWAKVNSPWAKVNSPWAKVNSPWTAY